MLQTKTPAGDVGVVVGRFQTHQLHQGHIDLIQTVLSKHKKAIVFVGVSAGQPTKRNPLDFATRREMILHHFPGVIVEPLLDKASDQEWSRNLNSKIREIFPIGKPILYGSRDSFITHYTEGYETVEFEPTTYESSTNIREVVSSNIIGNPDFRAGVIYATYNRFPTTYPTVDVAIISRDGKQVLLGRKQGETQYQFVGGFVDPSDKSLEAAAKREAFEETGVEIEYFEYILSRRIDDWRYRGEVDGITTTFFKAKHVGSPVQPGDDLVEAKWFDLDKIRDTEIRKQHRPLMDALLENLGKKYYNPLEGISANYAS